MGRKPKETVVGVLTKKYTDPKDFFLDLMNDATIDLQHRISAGRNLMPYYHTQEKVQKYKGKKEMEQENAVYVQSKFSTFQAPPGTKK